MKIYISGPITGVEGYMERFNEAEKALLAAGHEAVNPARVNAALPEGTTHEEYMEMSIVMLDMCDTIFVLDGWQQSKGCNIEIQHALQNGHTIAFEGGRGCQERANRQGQENSAQRRERKSFRETMENAYSAVCGIGWKGAAGTAGS